MFVKLLQSVGQQGSGGTGSRPLTPIECAQGIGQLKDDENGDLAKVSERLNLGKPKEISLYKKRDTSQVVNFLNLFNVSKKSRSLAGWSTDGFPKIPFSLVSQLASLAPDEQDLILQSVYNSSNKRVLSKEDVIKIKRWKNANADTPIDACIEKILKMKPVKTINYIVVCGLEPKLKKFIASHKDYRQILLKTLRKNLDGIFNTIDASDMFVSISMDDVAYDIFGEYQYKRNISFTKFLNDFLDDKLE